MAGPYRDAVAADDNRTSTRDGSVTLEVAPRHVLLTVGDEYTLSVTQRFASLTRMVRNKPRKRALKLERARLLVARAVPTDDIGIWHEHKPGVVTRLLGFRKHGLDSTDDLDKMWREYDDLVNRLQRALIPHAHEVKRSMEVGIGADRVLIMDFGDHLRFHVRRLFRERQRRAFEVHGDGTIVVSPPATHHEMAIGERVRRGLGNTDHRFTCTFQYGVTTMGDYIRFVSQQGDDLGRISLPWLRTEDRHELAKIITRRITQGTRSTSSP